MKKANPTKLKLSKSKGLNGYKLASNFKSTKMQKPPVIEPLKLDTKPSKQVSMPSEEDIKFSIERMKLPKI